MTRSLVLGGGKPAKWVIHELNAHQVDFPIFGLKSISREHYEDVPIIDFVDPADFTRIIRKLSQHKVSSLALLGTGFSQLTLASLAKSAIVLMRHYTKNSSSSLNPSIALPYDLFTAVNHYLNEKGIETFGIQDELPHLQPAPGSIFGRGKLSDIQHNLEAIVQFHSTKRKSWRKHGTVKLADGQFFRQLAGTRGLLKSCYRRGKDLSRGTLLIEEGEEFKNLDIPIIHEDLIQLAITYGLESIIVKGRNIVIDEAKLRGMTDSSGLSVYFI